MLTNDKDNSNDNIFTFEADPKRKENEIQSDNGSLNINGSSGSPSLQSDMSNNNNLLNTIQLSSKSREFLAIRILLLCLGCIFLPMEMILYIKLERIETTHTFPYISHIIDDSFVLSNTFYYISYTMITLLSNKDAIMIYISVLYFVSHPFVALKLVMSTNMIYYVITIMKCLYQAKRPFWLTENGNRFCYSSFANPSSGFFLVSFFLLYTIVSLNFLKTKKDKMTWRIKSVLIFAYALLIFISCMIFLLNRLNLLYQITFTLCISLLIICLLIDFESSIHNMILKSMKNTFKTRKYKIKILFYILSLSIISVLIYFFIVPDNLITVEENLSANIHCSKEQIEELGIQYTFIEIPYIFGIIGSFWGASLTIEYECNKWWNSSVIKTIIKVAITVVFSIGYLLLFKYVFVHLTYEFDFVIECLKYMIYYYVVMGVLPIVYHFFGLNEKKHKGKNQKSLLFTKTIFTDTGEQFENVFVGDGKLCPDDEEKKGLNEIKEEENEDENSKIYRESQIIGDIRKQEEEKIEFTVKIKDDYFNN